MNNLQLGYDEGIILESEDVSWVSRNGLDLTHFVLTNRNIYCIYEKSNGLFKKPTVEQCILSLSDVKIINGQALVQQMKYDGSWCLQVQFRQGVEYFEFSDSPKKIIPQWVAAINNTLGTSVNVSTPTPQTTKRNSLFGGAFAEVADSFKSVVDTASETFGLSPKQSNGNNTYSSVSYNNTISQQPNHQPQPEAVPQAAEKNSFCINCGNQLSPGTKFCPSCGHKVGNVNETTTVQEPVVSKTENTYIPPVQERSVEPPKEEVKQNSNSQRQQEYVGKIFKCPHCGEVVNQSDTVCGTCGYHLSGKQAMWSAMDFQQQLLKIEMMRQDKKIGFWDQREALDATDKQMIALIKSYPIPNTIEDIVEFFHLAIGNIDVAKSKKSVFNTDGWDGGSRERAISNAWVGKLQQIYKKAELYFPNELEFAHIKEAYQEMMKELKLS